MGFSKPPRTYDQQLELLIERGMNVPDPPRALHYLSHLNYYRLEAYWLPFETSRSPHVFAVGTSFDQVLNHYLFDRELRLLLLDAIERIEVSFRTQWAYQMSHHCGPHGYLENRKGTRKNEGRFKKDINDLAESVNRSDEVFISHFKENYDEELPPVWVSCEVMSLGLLSRFYSNLRIYSVRRGIAATYGVGEGFLEGFMEHLTYVRNICAHHSRLWNRHLKKKMPLPRGKPAGLRESIHLDHEALSEHKIYNTLVVIQHLMEVVCPDSSWARRMAKLLDDYEIDTDAMGFPTDWELRPVWSSIEDH